ncbi:MAG: FMN-binding negative transcriptional regulator [Geminicoccaceae bacterium]
MYVANAFRQSAEEAWRIVEEAPFALVVSHGMDGLRASHTPILRDGENGLIGHLAKANPQWRDLDGARAMCVFSGVHTHISPTWYATSPAVPTWDYVAAQLSGTVELVKDAEGTGELLEKLSERFESDSGWRFSDQPETFRTSMLRGVVAFRMTVETIEVSHKLSQNRSEADRRGVVEGLRARASGDDLAIAERIEAGLGKTISP